MPGPPSLCHRGRGKIGVSRFCGNIDISSITIDQFGLILDWNGRAEAMFGWSEEEVFGYRMAEKIIPPRYRQAHEWGLEHFLRTGEGPILGRRIEMTGLRRNGEEFPVEISVSPLQIGSKWLGSKWLFTVFLRDITALKRAEERLRQVQRVEALEQLAGGIAHDFNNLLTAINGYGTLAMEGLEPGSPRFVFQAEILKTSIGKSNAFFQYIRLVPTPTEPWSSPLHPGSFRLQCAGSVGNPPQNRRTFRL